MKPIQHKRQLFKSTKSMDLLFGMQIKNNSVERKNTARHGVMQWVQKCMSIGVLPFIKTFTYIGIGTAEAISAYFSPAKHHTVSSVFGIKRKK